LGKGETSCRFAQRRLPGASRLDAGDRTRGFGPAGVALNDREANCALSASHGAAGAGLSALTAGASGDASGAIRLAVRVLNVRCVATVGRLEHLELGRVRHAWTAPKGAAVQDDFGVLKPGRTVSRAWTRSDSRRLQRTRGRAAIRAVHTVRSRSSFLIRAAITGTSRNARSSSVTGRGIAQRPTPLRAATRRRHTARRAARRRRTRRQILSRDPHLQQSLALVTRNQCRWPVPTARSRAAPQRKQTLA